MWVPHHLNQASWEDAKQHQLYKEGHINCWRGDSEVGISSTSVCLNKAIFLKYMKQDHALSSEEQLFLLFSKYN